MLRIETIVNGMLSNNTYLVINEKNEAIIIDPSSGVERITETVAQHGCKVKYILLTHAHYDHFMGLDPIQREYQCNVYIHKSIKSYLKDASLNLSSTSPITRRKELISYVKPKTFTEGKLELEGFDCQVFFNPGHTKGCSSFIFDNEWMFSGDFLFKGTIGRTDFFDSNLQALKDNLVRLSEAYTNLKVLPGHGPATTLKSERKNNPFL